MNNYFNALRGRDAFARFIDINKNTSNSYRSGYEHYFDQIPRVLPSDSDAEINGKLEATSEIINKLANELWHLEWALANWPKPGAMLRRIILGIDRETSALIVLCHWNKIETPIHGHAYGQMLDYLMIGEAEEIEYDIVDSEKRLVVENEKRLVFTGPAILSNGYHKPETGLNTERGALVHKFVTKTRAVTLHLVPEMPRDAKGNLFTEAESLQHH